MNPDFKMFPEPGQSMLKLGSFMHFHKTSSPALCLVWISSRPESALRDLRSLKATTGTTSSSLPESSCAVLVPTGVLAMSSIVPLCGGSVFSFGGLLADTDFCDFKDIKPF